VNKIIASVGRNGTNHSADIVLVQKLLNAQKIPGEITPLKEDGVFLWRILVMIKEHAKRWKKRKVIL